MYTDPPVQIEIKGTKLAGKTMLLNEIVHHLSSKGLRVRCFDEPFGEIPPEDCKPIKKEYEPTNTVYIYTNLEPVDESIFPEKSEA